jgi:hypothetical protein
LVHRSAITSSSPELVVVRRDVVVGLVELEEVAVTAGGVATGTGEEGVVAAGVSDTGAATVTVGAVLTPPDRIRTAPRSNAAMMADRQPRTRSTDLLSDATQAR